MRFILAFFIIYIFLYTILCVICTVLGLYQKYEWLQLTSNIIGITFMAPYRILELVWIIYMSYICRWFLHIYSTQYQIQECKILAIGLFISTYLVIWNILSIVYWIYPYTQYFLNNECSPGFILMRNICTTMYYYMPFI